MAGGPTPTNADIARQREDDVVRLRTRDRMTFREIAAALNCDVKNAYDSWKSGRTRLHAEAVEAFGAYVGEQLATCRQIIDGLMPRILQGDSRAAEAAVKAMDHEARLLGLYAPVRANVTVTDEMTARVKQLAEELAEL
jgi:hypothetical protein